MNDMQLEAVLHTEGPLLVLAGAGSGKTTVLVNRCAAILEYGRAASTDELSRPVTSSDVEAAKAYIDGDEFAYDEFADLMSVDAPKPWQMLAITFTNKAAEELKNRLEAMLGTQANDIWASTFHSACSRILRRFASKLGYTEHFTIYDTDDSRRCMKECMKSLGVEEKILGHKQVLNEIGRAKDSLISPADFAVSAGSDFRLQKIASLYEAYQQTLKRADAMDFDDMIFNTVTLLESDPEVLDFYQNRFRYIMVDEYQDTSHAQYRLVSLLAGSNGNICVVGDDDQSIYKFRGATIENILSFERSFPGAVTIRLEQNYRSTQNILDAANAVIANNEQRKGKNLWTDNGAGDKIVLHTSYDETDEAAYIADIVNRGIASGKKYRDFAVLYRANAQSGNVENAFVRSGIPYSIFGGHKFYDRKEIRDAVAYLTVINNPGDDIRLRRIINEPKRGIGDATLSKASDIAVGLGISLYEVISHAEDYPAISRAASRLNVFVELIERCREKLETESLDSLFVYCLNESGYVDSLASDPATAADRVQNLRELAGNLKRFQEEDYSLTLTDFLEEVALMTDIDDLDQNADRAVMMTLHSAKGLEFDTVFIIGMEEGVFPGNNALYDPNEIEEERRLAYVGITRAKKALYLTKTRTRMLYGSTTHNRVSRFVEEIPHELIKETGVKTQPYFGSRSAGSGAGRTGVSLSTEKKPQPIRLSGASKASAAVASYSAGDSVRHPAFGPGLVLSVKPMGNDVLLEIAFDTVGTKKLMAKFAKLQKL